MTLKVVVDMDGWGFWIGGMGQSFQITRAVSWVWEAEGRMVKALRKPLRRVSGSRGRNRGTEAGEEAGDGLGVEHMRIVIATIKHRSLILFSF